MKVMRFSILTPTYNRAHLLGDVFGSLCKQTFGDFEWIIVDDGSIDNTRELVSSWRPQFPMRYIHKPNGGKHTAVNVGLYHASGELLCLLDSDDLCLPLALERFDFHWKALSREPDADHFACLIGLCCLADGRTLGSGFPAMSMDASTVGENLALLTSDRWGVIRTDVFRRFPYPVFQHEKFLPEGVVWNRIFRRYKSRYINEALKIVRYQADGLSNRGDMRWQNPKGAVLYHTELALSNAPVMTRIKSAINAARFSLVVAAKGLRLTK